MKATRAAVLLILFHHRRHQRQDRVLRQLPGQRVAGAVPGLVGGKDLPGGAPHMVLHRRGRQLALGPAGGNQPLVARPQHGMAELAQHLRWKLAHGRLPHRFKAEHLRGKILERTAGILLQRGRRQAPRGERLPTAVEPTHQTVMRAEFVCLPFQQPQRVHSMAKQ